MRAEQILRPARPSFIVVSLLTGFCLQLLPLGHLAWWPDVLMVVLAFWALHQPQRIGIGVAFMLGLAMDVQGASLLGQHALAYCVLVFVVQAMQNRLLWYQSGWQQAVLLLLPFALTHLCLFVVGAASSRVLPSPWLLLAPLLQALLWVPLRRLLLVPQMSPPSARERRPI
ncbi:rod shape-determining protein MreD [Corticibacter populi]|uniref:Rod shape-determining protein MreD n=2 Tax=Corticibacter populi TaxID=1550736 RepID=A0A3M6QP63_9BURK|nr:rod shape-determining protein MreD [Corticibacter populi]